MRRKVCLFMMLFVAAIGMQAQIADPVHFSTKLNMLDNNEAEIVFSATIDPGWHVYSTDITDDGPTKATFHTDKMEGVELVGKMKPRGKVTEEFDEMFGTNLRFFVNQGAFVQKIRFAKPQYAIEGYLEYGACNDQMCMPPTQVEYSFKGNVTLNNIEQKEEAQNLVAEPQDITAKSDSAVTDSAAIVALGGNESDALWQPIIEDLKAFEEGGSNTSSSLWYIFLSGLLGGFLAILTPCVWPIIPMTVSFFLKRNKERKKAIQEAVTYGLSIVIIYVLLGLAVTLLFGASALNALSTNAVFNIFFALLLIVFAASFFGAFELTLPSSWSNKIDQKSENTTGLLSIFLMAFTLTLVSFSCTGPIIGFLLVAVSTQGDIIAPTIGMLGFAIALAIPFTIFALFPSLLKAAPKSGGWMNTVKVVLGPLR